MQTSPSPLPDLRSLTLGLASVFGHNGHTDNSVTILDRQPNNDKTTFPSEVVTCRLSDGRELRLFCKYEAGRSHKVYGHRGDVAYEATVYRNVLTPLQTSTPMFFGAYKDAQTGETWLVLEYLEQNIRVRETPERVGMSQAAHWIGRFHAINQARLLGEPIPDLTRYDVEYYRGWVHRTSLFAGHLHQRLPWLATVCEHFEEFVDYLLAAPPTIIHGEYCGKNVLSVRGVIYPIDWESAAIAAGEIDLASLAEGYSEKRVCQMGLAYQQARWPDGTPAEFERTLAAARLYLQFRWLGEKPKWTIDEDSFWRFEQLRVSAEQLGLI